MATFESPAEAEPIAINSTATALCILPPAHLCQDIDRLRMLYDKAYGKWPAHINVVYPFVAAEDLPRAMELVSSKIVHSSLASKNPDIRLRLDESGYFAHRYRSTIYKTDGRADGSGIEELRRLRSAIIEAFTASDETYRPHLTIGQCGTEGTSQHEHLLEKAGLLPPIEWHALELAVLVREKVYDQKGITSRMKIWGTIDFNGNIQTNHTFVPGEEDGDRLVTGGASAWVPGELNAVESLISQLGTTFQFSLPGGIWAPYEPSNSIPNKDLIPDNLTVSSYNVLVDSTYPSRADRYSLLLWAILSETALADILVLQEVSDDFLSFLLADSMIRDHYPFSTHGPPNQSGIGPLTSLCNVVVLSRWGFSWKYVPFHRRHKGAVVLTMETIGEFKESQFFPLVIGGVHLTCGLTDGSVAAKKSQLQTVINHLSQNYSHSPWIVAGDFNITTSTSTINAAVKSMSISLQTSSTLATTERMLADAQLTDAWFVARTEAADTPALGVDQSDFYDVRDGEQGATFDPMANALAAEIVGGKFCHRPQRYDRILIRGENLLRVRGFNMFGAPGDSSGETYKLDTLVGSGPHYGSDHWGVRSSLKINHDCGIEEPADVAVSPLQLRKAPTGLTDLLSLRSYLEEHSMLPSDDEIDTRKEILALIRGILQQSGLPEQDGDTKNKDQVNISPVVVPVGSYGLGVWSTSSDIDCLCVGPISPRLFFKIAAQRLGKADHLGVKILRKVNAASGRMLELDIRGVKVDIQYCAAVEIAERWQDVMRLPESDPSFYLPIRTLEKLAPFRDLDYLQRTIPDLTSFRIAHRFIRAWATQRGINSSKFGYLGGIHITLMLSRVCKLLFREEGAVTTADIICTFFHHYAEFDWKTTMVFDPFFHKQQPRPHQSAREPMVILGLHAPRVNVAHTASPHSTWTVVNEFKRVDNLLSNAQLTWERLVGASGTGIEGLGGAVQEFLTSYSSYAKIDVHYWGVSPTKGNLLVGWLESRCVYLLVDLNRKLPDIHARIWPARFAHRDCANDEKERDYQGCYLIGLSKKESSTGPLKTESDRRTAHGVLQSVLGAFSERTRGDRKYFDPKTSWLDVTLVKRSELGELKLDHSTWGDSMAQDYESDSDSEDDEEASELEDDNFRTSATSTKPSAKSKKTARSGPAAAHKLRPATDILNRLRWDPDMDSGNYVIGYEDRFLGVREIGLEKWTSEQTDEEFIPQHRILYFRRRSDRVVVWDREARKDDIYGSGAGRG